MTEIRVWRCWLLVSRVTPGILSISHSPRHITLLQSERPLQASEEVTNQRRDRGQSSANQKPARCGPWDHCQHEQHFQSLEFFWFEIKLEFECVWLFRERGVFYILHIFTHVYTLNLPCQLQFYQQSIKWIVSPSRPSVLLYLQAVETAKNIKPGLSGEMDEAASVDWCCLKTLFISQISN